MTGQAVGSATTTRLEAPALDVSGLSKTFGATTVLTDFDLQVPAGEVHALVGQNGSGKSTFIKILSGYQPPDAGARISVAGDQAGWWDRIAFVHQDLGFIDSASIVENLAGSTRRPVLGVISWKKERAKAEEVIALAGLAHDPDVPMRALQPVDKALLAIARARHELREKGDAVLVLDEPTAYLPSDRVQELLAQIGEAASSGIAVVLVTHHLKEVTAAADRVTVLRDGHVVFRSPVADTSEDRIVEAMIGTKLTSAYPELGSVKGGAPVLAVDGLRATGLGPVDLTVAPGEIVGLAGLVASGWETVPYALVGAAEDCAGRLSLGGEAPVDLAKMDPRTAVRQGIALVPADRVRDSAVGELTVEENLTLLTLRRLSRGVVLDRSQRRRLTEELLEKFEVRPAIPDVAMGTLSGGNQQKVLMAKWLEMNPALLVLHEPTQGVDVGARRQILEHVIAAAEQGAGVLIASAEHEDLAHLCHRVLVFRDGVVDQVFEGDGLTEEHLLRAVQGVVPDAAA